MGASRQTESRAAVSRILGTKKSVFLTNQRKKKKVLFFISVYACPVTILKEEEKERNILSSFGANCTQLEWRDAFVVVIEECKSSNLNPYSH